MRSTPSLARIVISHALDYRDSLLRRFHHGCMYCVEWMMARKLGLSVQALRRRKLPYVMMGKLRMYEVGCGGSIWLAGG